MNLSKRIALSSTVILVFFFGTVLVFLWSNEIRRVKVDELQSTIRSQYLISDVSDELGEFNKHLQVLEITASVRGEVGLEDQEREKLMSSISKIESSLANVRATAAGSIASQLSGTASARGIVIEWKDLINWTIENNERIQIETLTDFTIEFKTTRGQLLVDSAVLRTRSQELDMEIDQQETLINKVSLIVFVVSAVIALILLFHLIRYTTRALSALREGTEQWSSGNLEYRIKVVGKDDLSALARAFNGMANNLDAAMKDAQEERKRADKANKAKSGFLANMSHELRTPMNAIIGYSEMLLEEIEDEGSLSAQEAAADLSKIQSAGKHLLGLINEILDLSKIESGKMGVFYEPIDLGILIDDVKTTIMPLIDKFDNGFEVIIDVKDSNIETDVTKFRQILMNLLSNSAKFTKEGLITVTAKRFMEKGVDTISVAVSDTGIGMTEVQLAKVFDEFTQADDSTTREFGGTGLGLSICRSFATLMKGRIDVVSKPGKGTTFTFVAPAFEPKKEVATRSASKDKKDDKFEGSGLATILVIDDDEVSLEISERILRKKGYSVITASSGDEGILKARESQPDVIVLDVIMPGMDGWQVLEQLKQDESTTGIPIIMQSMLSERELGLAKGADDYLTKPIDKANLTDAVRKLIPDVNMDNGLLIIEQGSLVVELIKDIAVEKNWGLTTTADLSEARQWLGEKQFGLVLIGKHSDTDDVSRLMEQLARGKDTDRTPMLLLSSIEIEDSNPEQLLSYLNIVSNAQSLQKS
ncbi:MAG: signal transduction histidine kinase/DNA-binding response OmpR family regulator [Lysobacterales bacterium]|jgi:signal transduction histidine kinase/DNA-binding response OmpR family regulator